MEKKKQSQSKSTNGNTSPQKSKSSNHVNVVDKNKQKTAPQKPASHDNTTTLLTRSSGLLIAGLSSGYNGLDVRLKKNDERTDRVISPAAPDIELLNAGMAKRELANNLSMVDLPLEATEKFGESTLGKLLDGSELSGDAQAALSSMVSNAATQYFLSVEERRAYLDIAMQSLKESHTMEERQWGNLEKELDTILTDGFKKSFRDGFGRSLPIPEATSLARSVEASTLKLQEALGNGDIVGDVHSIVTNLQRYLRLEQRSRFAVTEVEKDMVMREAVSITDAMSEFPVIGALVLNRFLYTSRSDAVMMKVPRFAVAPNLGGREFDLRPVTKFRGPNKIVSFKPHGILSAESESALQFVSSKDLLTYISDKVGFRHIPSENDLVAEILGMSLDIDRIKKALSIDSDDGKSNPVSSQSALDELFGYLFKEKLVDVVIDSFSVAPSFSSQTLNSIRTSAYDEETIKRVEPFIIGVDNLKDAYFGTIKDMIQLLRPRLIADIPTLFLNSMMDSVESEHSFSFSINSDQVSWFKTTLAMFNGLVIHPKPVTIKQILPHIDDVSTSWDAITRVTHPGERVKVIHEDVIASAAAEAHVGRIQPRLMLDIPDDIMMVIETATTGKFTTIPYAKYDVRFDSSLLTELFSYMSLRTFEATQKMMNNYGLNMQSDPEPVLIDPTSDPKHYLIASLLKLSQTKQHWVIKTDPELFIIPEFSNNLVISDGRGGIDKLAPLTTPWLSLKTFDKGIESLGMSALPFTGKVAGKVDIVPDVWPAVRYSYTLNSRLSTRAPRSTIDMMRSDIDEKFAEFQSKFRDEVQAAVLQVPGLIDKINSEKEEKDE